MPKRARRNHSSEQEAALLKCNHVEKIPVSDLCNKQKLQPSLFYTWQRQLFENASAVFDGSKTGVSAREQELQARIAQLEAKLAKKDAVNADISEEYVKLQKELGEP
ncbi:transposase [Sorangium sp. So ce381]|uniref:transposase n=1 Tax=Sorangium sp. So ce381 TaxID=3133307 RepID=UPI003F5B6AFD